MMFTSEWTAVKFHPGFLKKAHLKGGMLQMVYTIFENSLHPNCEGY